MDLHPLLLYPLMVLAIAFNVFLVVAFVLSCVDVFKTTRDGARAVRRDEAAYYAAKANESTP